MASSQVFVPIPAPYAASNVLGALLLGVLLTQARTYMRFGRRDALRIRVLVVSLVGANVLFAIALFADMLIQLDGDHPMLWQVPSWATRMSFLVLPHAMLPAQLFYVDRIHTVTGCRVVTTVSALLTLVSFLSVTMVGILFVTEAKIQLDDVAALIRPIWVVWLASIAAFDVLIAATLSFAFARVRRAASFPSTARALLHLGRLAWIGMVPSAAMSVYGLVGSLLRPGFSPITAPPTMLMQVDTLNDRQNLLCSDAAPVLADVERPVSRVPPSPSSTDKSLGEDMLTVKEMLEGPSEPPTFKSPSDRPLRSWLRDGDAQHDGMTVGASGRTVAELDDLAVLKLDGGVERR